jgi:hypothetical protein
MADFTVDAGAPPERGIENCLSAIEKHGANQPFIKSARAAAKALISTLRVSQLKLNPVPRRRPEVDETVDRYAN